MLPMLRWEALAALTWSQMKGGWSSPMTMLGFPVLAKLVSNSTILIEKAMSSLGSGRKRPIRIGNRYLKIRLGMMLKTKMQNPYMRSSPLPTP